MSKWSDGFVPANGIQIHYYRTGGDKPAVVINHGAGDDGMCWTRVARELEAEYDLILPDARGHGKSASGNGDYSAAARVADLAGLIMALRLDRPVVGGHSLGADTSLHLAAEHPELARAIFLEDPPVVLPGEQLFDPTLAHGKDIGKMMRQGMMMFKLMPKFIGLRMARKAMPTYPEDEIIPWTESKERLSMNFLNAMTILDFGGSAPFEALKKVAIPVLLIIGDKEKMSIVSQDTAREIARLNEHVQVVHLEGASHDIRRTRFDGYVPALKKFLGENHPS